MRYLYNQQNKFGNCFILPNSIMQLNLSPIARLIYFYLVYIEDRKTYQCYPSYKTIGKALTKRSFVKRIITRIAKAIGRKVAIEKTKECERILGYKIDEVIGCVTE